MPSPSLPRRRSMPQLPAVSAARARQHEALVLRLEALLMQVRPLAARRPDGRVGTPLRILAEGLLYDAGRFGPRRQRREKLPVAATRLGPLLVQLGEARARLEAFELSHSSWSATHKAYVWRATPPLPIGRLKPQLSAAPADDRRRLAQRDEMRRKLLQRLEDAYESGYRDAQSGTPRAAAEALKSGA